MTRQYVRCPVADEHRRFAHAPASDRAAAALSDLNLYHWSPRERRNRILRYGLVPGSHSVGREWRPPYVCFADDVNLAWILSGKIHPEIADWDLWQVYPDDLDRWELILDTYVETGRHYIKEYRVYDRIPKRHVHYIASRSQSDYPSHRS